METVRVWNGNGNVKEQNGNERITVLIDGSN